VGEAQGLLEELQVVGVDYDDVVETLEREGIAKFSASFASILDCVHTKRGALVTEGRQA
jgi:transaldolase